MKTPSLTPVRKMDIGLIRQMLNNENITADERTAAQQQIQELPEIFRLLASLEDDTQKLLLNNWARAELVLNEETVGQLLDYLSGSPAESSSEKLAVIKAFAFLELNNLPKTEQLVDTLRSVFTQDNSLTRSLNELLNGDQLSREAKKQLKTELNLNIDKNIFKQNTAENIKNHLNKSDLLLSLLDKNSSDQKKSLLDNLLGQKLINIELQENNSPFILALEIPLELNEQNKLLPLFLKIAEEQKDENESKSKYTSKSYQITLITELPKFGTIKSSIKLKDKILSALFLSETEKTARIIKNNLEKLKIILADHGFKIGNLKTAVFENNSSRQSDFFNKAILSEFNIDNNSKGKYTHLDIRI